jgi:TrmH family RNA methyltransferase
MQKVSQATGKQLRLLHQKKHREAEGVFLVEGAKPVLELIKSGWKTQKIVLSEAFFEKNLGLLQGWESICHLASPDQLSQFSHLESNRDVLAVVEMPEKKKIPDSNEALWLVLDQISDPGNLGTIIRLADWFGLKEVITLGNTVEWFNPKVVNASKGSFLRVAQVKMELPDLLKTRREFYLADMGGQSLHQFSLPSPAKKYGLVIGQESHGIGPEWKKQNYCSLSIPSYGMAESLNAAVATGILLHHFRYLEMGFRPN